MRKGAMWAGVVTIPLAAFFIWKFAFFAPTAVPQLVGIERMTDTRDPKRISGSFWTKHLDCSYRNPAEEWIVWSAAFECEQATHNLNVLRTKKDYFIPRSTANNEPPFCLVNGPALSRTVAAAEDRKRLYCRK